MNMLLLLVVVIMKENTTDGTSKKRTEPGGPCGYRTLLLLTDGMPRVSLRSQMLRRRACWRVFLAFPSSASLSPLYVEHESIIYRGARSGGFCLPGVRVNYLLKSWWRLLFAWSTSQIFIEILVEASVCLEYESIIY